MESLAYIDSGLQRVDGAVRPLHVVRQELGDGPHVGRPVGRQPAQHPQHSPLLRLLPHPVCQVGAGVVVMVLLAGQGDHHPPPLVQVA